MMKKSLSLILAILLIFGLVSCAGGNDQKPEPSAAEPSAPTASEAPSATEAPVNGLPITAEKSELNVWCSWGYSGNTTFLRDWNDAVGYKAVEEKTNVHINWIIPTDGSESEAFNIMMASNDYPDIIFNFTNYYTSGLQHAVDNDIILPLDDIIQQYMPNYLARINVSEDRQKRAKTDSGIHAAIFMVSSEKAIPLGRTDYSQGLAGRPGSGNS
jgi:putative aldouronate transport system substrate-binding protein